MNIRLETLPQCQATMRVEIPPDAVGEERNSITRSFLQGARLPGYRKGKAPLALIESRFSKDIHEELESRLLNQGYSEGVKQESLNVISIVGVEDQSFHPDDSYSFTTSLLLAPEFELPDYKGIALEVPKSEVSDEEVENTLGGLRERFAEFSDVEGRAIAMGDFAIVDYQASLEGKPLQQAVDSAPAHLATQTDYWIKMDEDSFLPGLCAGLVGAAIGESRPIPVTLPEGFPLAELASKEVTYQVTLKEIKEQKLPEFDDDLADKIQPGKTLEEIREAIREQLLAEKTNQVEQLKTNQVIAWLDEQLDFDLPAELVNSETQRQVNELVQRGHSQGMDEDTIRSQQEEIINSASGQAKLNIKTSFILEEIGEKENIHVADPEILAQIAQMAAQRGVPPKKLLKQLQAENGIGRIRNHLRISKTLDFLRANASVKEVDPPEQPVPET